MPKLTQNESRRRWSARQLCVVFAILLAVLGVVWWSVSANFCAEQARAALADSHWSRADSWIALGRYCRGSQVRLCIVRSRLCGKRGDLEGMEAALGQAKILGASENIIVRERVLSAASAGKIEPLEEHLGIYLPAGEDLPEICESYVLGCLSNYKLKEAQQILDLWQSDFPRDPRPHLLRARLQEHLGELDQALAEFRRAWDLSKSYAPAAYNVARILTNQNQHAESLKWYRIAANQLVEPEPALIGEARSLRELGRLDEARRQLVAAESRHQPNRKRQIDDAYRIVGESSESDAAQLSAEFGQLELAAGNPESAATRFFSALSANPKNWRTRYSYSLALRRLGKITEADSELSRVEIAKQVLSSCDRAWDILQQNPRDIEARFTLGAAVLDHVSENQGLIWLHSVLAIDPHHCPTHRKLAEFYAANEGRLPEFKKLAEWHHTQAQVCEQITTQHGK